MRETPCAHSGGRGGPRRLATWLVLLLATFLASPVLADEASDILNRMSVAVRTLDYQGSFTYEHAGRVDTLRVFHAGSAGRERERLVVLNGPRSELVRDGAEVTCTQADGSTIVYSSSTGRGLLPLVPTTDSSGLGEHYEIKRIGDDRVAGYRADVVDVVPRDRFRYGYRLWLERDTRLLLRSIVTDSERRPLEQVMFVSLDIGTPPAEADLVPQNRGTATATATVASPASELVVRGPPHWQVTMPPAGFTFVSARRPRQGPEQAEHLVYSDGLATVSVYVEPRGDAPPGFDTLAGRGTINVFSQVQDEWRITVLGDVPIATVRAMGESVRPRGD